MKKKILIALLIVVIASVSVMAFAGCNQGVKVGFQTGTTGQSYTEEYINLSPINYQNIANAVQDMVTGRIDYVITDIAPAQSIVNHENFAGKVKGRFVPDIMEDIPKRPLGYHAINILVGKIVKADAVPERRQEGKG